MELNRIYTENCLETMTRMPDGFIDLTVTSPPYDNLRTYNGYQFDFEPIARELFRVTKKGGVVVWVVGDATINGSETTTSSEQKIYFRQCGFNIHDTMIYRKLNFAPLTHNRYEQEWEYMFAFSKGKPQTFTPIRIPAKWAGHQTWGNPAYYKTNDGSLTAVAKGVIADEKIRGNIFEYRTGSTLTGDVSHPAMFPEQLAVDQILSWSNENDIIYDPFMGSGTTAKAAHQLKRRWIGSEISSEYVELANKRLEPYLAQEQLF